MKVFAVLSIALLITGCVKLTPVTVMLQTDVEVSKIKELICTE